MTESPAPAATPAEQYTRCPACKTIFRVTPQQLAVRAGQVRCGQCQTVFDGNAQLLPISQVSTPAAPEDGYNETVMGPATMTLRPPRSPIKESTPEINYDERFKRARWARLSRGATVAYAIGAPLLLLLLATQAVFHFRHLIAARFPATRPAMVHVCATLGCAIQPVRDIEGVTIEASDLQVDPAHRGLLTLNAILRNRASWPLRYPYLELTLTDTNDQTVARRALQPLEYAGGTADLNTGIPANGEVPIKLFIDASATRQDGYRLSLFYP